MRDVNCPAFRVSKAGMVLTEVANAKPSADLKKTLQLCTICFKYCTNERWF